MFVKLYAMALPVFLAIDAVWLGVVAKNLYREQIGSLMKTNANWFTAILFYLLFIAGLVYFVITPAIEQNRWQLALLAGALFGLVTYATYDLTNLATLKDWPITITIIDLIWGASISAAVSTIVYFIANKLAL